MKLNDCPVCGHTPIIVTKSLDRGNGRGYPGHFEYRIKCSNKQCPLTRQTPFFETTDVYCSKEEVYDYLGEKWNEEAIKIDELISHRKSHRRVDNAEMY